jgi:hypothetical protein
MRQFRDGDMVCVIAVPVYQQLPLRYLMFSSPSGQLFAIQSHAHRVRKHFSI